jgi:hypothetical protein
MRALKSMLIFVFLIVPAAAFSNDLSMARISLIDGDVQVLIQDTTDWTAGVVNLPLNEGDRMWVPDNSRAELQLQRGVYIRADADTALDVLTITQDSAQFYLDRGHIYINNRRGGIKTAQVDTPMSSIRSYDNSIMMIDVSEDGVTEVSVLKGYAFAESRAGATRVAAGNTLTIRGEDNADVAPLGSPDDWERWNVDRDRSLTAWGESSRYLPDELHEYSSDFDENGRWQYVADYGYIWTPTVVTAGWAPYTAGRWLWIRGSYVWIDYDPWGWVPCHYGRWAFVSPYGWSWVPPSAGAVYWGPGFVGWIVTPTYVAWVPLAPGEIYYGYGYYGPWSKNITNVNINTVVVNRRYRNASVANSVVAVQRDSFGTGRRTPVKIKENPFAETRQRPGGDINIVPPRGKPKQPVIIVPPERRESVRNLPQLPVRDGRRPVVPPSTATRTERPAVTPPAVAPPAAKKPPERQALPPERFRKIQPEEMKNERRLVKDRDASVFRPQPPENLPVRKMNEPRVIKREPGQPQKKVNQGEGRAKQRE